MPPRYAYWTILLGDEPTSFRSGSQEDLMPTFKRLQQKHPSARMMWFQNGKLWPSRLDAQEAMRARGEMGRRGDDRQGGFRARTHGPRFPAPGSRDSRDSRTSPAPKLEWRPKSEGGEARPARPRSDKPEWRPKSQAPAYAKAPAGRPGPKPQRPEWRPKGQGAPAHRERKPFRPSGPRGPMSARSEKLEWKPKSERASESGEKRKWVPKEEYKRSQGIEAKKDKNWRPGGDHKDPRQKYKDAKKAKWTRFKQTVRKRWEGKPGRKKKDG